LLLILWQQLNHQLSTIFNTKPFEQTSWIPSRKNGLGIDDMIEVLTPKFGIKKKADGLKDWYKNKMNKCYWPTYLQFL
jgi:hypothetical protein